MRVGLSSFCEGVRGPAGLAGESSRKGLFGESLSGIGFLFFVDEPTRDLGGVTGATGATGAVVWRQEGGGDTGALMRYWRSAGGGEGERVSARVSDFFSDFFASFAPVQNSFSLSSSSWPLRTCDVLRFFLPTTTVPPWLPTSESLSESVSPADSLDLEREAAERLWRVRGGGWKRRNRS